MFTVRSNEEQVVGGSNKILMTGVSQVKLKAVGSDLSTLVDELGYENAKEGKPAFDVSQEGNRRVRVDFWLETEKGAVWKESFFIEETPRTNTDKTKTEFVNSVGQFAFGDVDGNAPSYEWYNQDGVRPAFRGEAEFVEFVRTLANLKTGKDGDIININFEKLFKGDFSDFKLFQKNLEKAGNTMSVLLTIRTVDGDNGPNYYQSMYRKVYARPYENAFVKFQKSLSGAYGSVRDNETYQDSLELQVFNPTAVKAPSDAQVASEVTAAPWV
jgi:hypothetical protein